MKKVLIITYYWPPSGGIGVQRCLKFAKYLKDFGWEPVVYTAKNADYQYFDETNFKDIPEGITILKKKILEPFSLFKKLSGRKKTDYANPVYAREKKVWLIDYLSIWIRGNFFIPDARSLWIKPSVRFLSKYLKDNQVDAILTDGPPHTNTIIGCKLSKKFNIPWLADFQDPWTQVDYYKMFKITKWADRKHKRLEQEVFKTAKKITIASPTWATDLEKIGANNVSPVFWGYDEEDFPEELPEPDNNFTIVHAGLLGYDRKPVTFFKVLKDLKNELKDFHDNLKLKFAGIVDYSVKEEMVKNNLTENFAELGNITRPEALNLIYKSRLLLLPLNIAENVKGRIPGKLFENIRSLRPILCLGPKGSDVEKIITSANAGKSFEYNDHDGIKSFIKDNYLSFIENKTIARASGFEEYSVKNQIKKVAAYLDEIL